MKKSENHPKNPVIGTVLDLARSPEPHPAIPKDKAG